VELRDGRVRYRFVVDIGRDANGHRQQKTFTLDRKRDAQQERARILHEVGRGTYVVPTGKTVNEVLDLWLDQACRDVEDGTASNYRNALLPVRERLGHRPVQSLVESDVDALVDWMLTAGRKRGGKPGTGLGVRAVSLTLGRFRSALNLAVRRQLVVRNVAIDTKIPRAARRADAEKRAERMPWTADEVRVFLSSSSSDRLYAAVLLLLMGLRPAEVCGLPWCDVDLNEGTLRVLVTRTIVDGRVVEKDPKSAAGKRVLPLPQVAITALRDARRQQVAERLAIGPLYGEGRHVLVDELGGPLKTDQLRRALYRLMESAGVRRVRPYDARHACLTYLAANGVPDVVVSAWAGHADLSLAKRVYVHPDATHLQAAADSLDVLLANN
jgi:integrase